MKYKKPWYEYKQPKRRCGAFEEQYGRELKQIRMCADEVTKLNEALFFSKSFLWEDWEKLGNVP